MALQAYARVDVDGSVRAMRHRIEHAYYPPLPGQLARMRDMGLVWSTQPAEIDEVGRGLDPRLHAGPSGRAHALAVGARPRRSDRHQQRLPGDVDRPPPGDPCSCHSAHGGRHRARSRTGGVGHRSAPDDTTGPAYIEGAEIDKGSLEPGKLADIVILSRDPLADPGDTLEGIDVTTTIVGGSIRYSREFETKEAAR